MALPDNEDIDAQRVAQYRELLTKPGGEAAIARRWGDDAVSSKEAAAAKTQLKNMQARQREVRERAIRAQRDAAQKQEQNAQKGAQNPQTRGQELEDKLASANKDLKANREQIAARSQSQDKSSALAM